MKILALGDCNTLGINDCRLNCFPELFAQRAGAEVVNRGYTMATTREGISLFDENFDNSFDIVLVSFGLTDSWKGIKHIPYIPYYPDNPLRKTGRKLVKKLKKTSRRLGLNRFLALDHVTPREEYIANLRHIIDGSHPAMVFLLDTLPIDSEGRNDDIILYNGLLDMLADEYDRVSRVRFHEHFARHREEFFQDRTHLNRHGCELLADYIYREYKKSS